MSSSSYDIIAEEYYDPRHITSRNFEAATEAFFARFVCPIPAGGHVLEVGAGRGSATKLCRVDSSRIVQTDISRAMLTLAPREASRFSVQCDALSLPFRSAVFVAVLAFLYDPYNRRPLYAEISRVLKPGGFFIGTMPHYTWGATLRRAIGYPLNKTRFVRYASPNQQMVELDSHLMINEEVYEAIHNARLDLVNAEDLFLPKTVTEISHHILRPAAALGLSPHKLPIIKLIVTRRLA